MTSTQQDQARRPLEGSNPLGDSVELHGGPRVFHRAVSSPLVLQTQVEWAEFRGPVPAYLRPDFPVL
jgi:hypothetical protein